MDPSKRDTLIQWINAIHPKETIESLLELRDGEQMIGLITTITSKSYDNVTVRKERYEVIQKFIEDYYSYDFCGQIHFDSDNELNIAKILVLVLSAGIQSEHQEEFMTPALSLDQRSQLEIMDILKEIVSDSPSKLNLDSLFSSRNDDTFDSVDVSCLFSPERTKTESKSCSTTAPSNGEPLQNRSTSTSSLNEILSPFGRINVGYSPACTTPLHSLINITGFSGRIIQRERNFRRKAENEIEVKENLIKKLSSELNMERHLRSDVELEMQEKVRTINSKDDKIRDLMTQNRSLKKLQDKLDELNTLQEDYDQMVTEIEKSKSSVGELKDLRLQNSSLKKEMNELYEELHSLKEMKSQLKILQLDCKKYVEELQKGEKKFASIQATLDLKQRALDDAINSKNFTEDHLVKMKEMYEDLKRQNEELVVFQSANELPGERMTVITNQLMDELKAELDDLKNTWIQPSIHEELKIQLANIVTERDSFESKSLKLSEEVFQVQSDNDMLKKKNEDFEIDLEKCQRHLQESQRNIEKLTANLDAFDTKETQWHQTEMKYKTDLQQLQTKMGQMQMELSCVSTELKLANAQLENDNKSSEMRRQTLVQSVGELRNEKKKLEQIYEAEKAAVEEKAKSLKSQLETLKMEFASREQELLAENESVAMERKDLEQQLETEKRLRENIERNLTSQREEVENELNEMIGQLKEDVKVAEAESQRLRHQIREKIDEYDGQVESLTNLKFDLQGKVSKLESQVRLDKQENLKLQTEMKVSGERCEEFELNIGKLTEKLNKLIADKKDCQEKLQEFEKKHEVALEESQHWIDKNSSDKKMFETQIKALEQERTEFAESTRCALEKLSGELKSSLDENCELKSQLQKRTDLLTETRQDLEEKSHQAETLQDQLSQVQQLYDHSQEQNSLLNNNFVTTQSQLACKESELTDLESKLDELLAEKTNLVESHEKELGATRQALSQEIVNLNQQIENSKSNLACFVDQVAKVTNIELGIGDVDKSLDIGKLVESVGKDIFHTVEDNSKKLAVAEERCTLQETRLLELEENLQVKNQEAEMLDKNLKESRDECQQLETAKGQQQHQLDENAALIKSLEEQKTVLDSQIVSDRESFTTQLENAVAEGSMANRLLEEKTAFVAELKEQSSMLDNELKSVREDMCQLEANNEKLVQKHKEIEEELSEKKLRLATAEENVSEMSLVLTEKNSLIQSQLETQSHLEESIASLNQKLSANDHETNLLKSNLEQKEALLEEKKTEFVNLSETLEATLRQMVELGDEHKSAMAAVQQEMTLDYEQKLDAVVADYENKICENYVGKSVIASLEVKRQAEIQELKKTLEQEHKKVVEELQVEYEAGMSDLKSRFETQMSHDAEEQSRKRETEIEELRENLEQEHKKVVEDLQVEYEAGVSDLKSRFETQMSHESEVQSRKRETEIEELKKTLEQEHKKVVEELQVEYEAGISDLKTQLSGEIQEQNQKHETKMKELKENLEQKHTKVVEELQVEYEAGVSDLKAQFETELSCKEQEKNQKRESEIKELRENLEQEHKKVVEDLQVEYEAGVSDLKAQFETELSCKEQEQNQKRESEIKELRENLEQEHKKVVEDLQVEYEAGVSDLKAQFETELSCKEQEKNQKRESEIKELRENLEQEHKKVVEDLQVEYEAGVSDLKAQFETELSCKEQEQNQKRESEIKELRENLEQEHKKVVEDLQVEYEAGVSDLKAQFETRLSCEAQEQNRKHFLEVDQLQKNVKEYCDKMELQQKEHKAALEKVVLEYQEQITNDFIPNSVFAEHKEKHQAEIAQIQNELAVDHEEKVQQITEEHQLSLKNLESSYEEKLIADYVPRQVAEEEKENLLLEVRKVQDIELQEKVTALQQEHEALVTQNENRNQEMSAEIATAKSELAEIMAKLSDKEKELSKQRAEFDLIVATSENVKEQNQASVAAYELRVSELEEKLGQQEMHVSCLEEQVINEKSEGERQVNEMKKRLEEQVTALKKHLDTAQQVLATANEMHKVESDQLRTQVSQLESCNQEKISQLTENYSREFEQMKQDYKEKILELETTYKEEIDQLKECHRQEVSASHAKYEEIQQNLLSSQTKAEEAVSLREQEMKAVHAEMEKQLKTEKFLIEEKVSVLEAECNKLKNDHESALKSKEDQIDSLNLNVAQLNEECRIRRGKCDKVERQLREREQKLIGDNMKILSKAEEMNRSLSNQLQVAQKEASLYQKKAEVSKKEVESLNNDLKLVKQMKQKTVNELQEEKINCMELKENFSSEKSQLERTIRELNEQYTESIAEIENLKKLVKHYENREKNKYSKVIQQNELDQRNIEKLTDKVFALEHEKKSLVEKLKREEEKHKTYDKENQTLQRKVSDLTEQLEKAGNALFDGNNEIDFTNASLDSPDIQEITKRTYELRSKSNNWNRMGIEDFNTSPLSFQSRNSISSIRSFTSNVSNISKTSKPAVCAEMFSCEDEPTTFDWRRITEIRRRNTMVPAHLRSTYPAELQNVPNSVNDEITNSSRSGSAKRKRKSPVPASKTQQTKVTGNRPATPGRVRRLRGRINVNNENSPQSDKKRLRTSTPQSKPDYTGRPSMVFEISNTPKLSKRRQKGQSTIFQLPEKKREPLKTRNSHQTHL